MKNNQSMIASDATLDVFLAQRGLCQGISKFLSANPDIYKLAKPAFWNNLNSLILIVGDEEAERDAFQEVMLALGVSLDTEAEFDVEYIIDDDDDDYSDDDDHTDADIYAADDDICTCITCNSKIVIN